MRNEEKDHKIDSFLERTGENRRPREDDDWDVPSRRPRRADGDGKKGIMWGIAILAGLAVVAGIVFLIVKEMKGMQGTGAGGERIIEREKTIVNSAGNDSMKIDQGKYQAIFLTNGQVYFGRVGFHDGSYVELSDIYYLQVKPVLQQSEGENKEGEAPAANQEQKTELSLVKLGNELHGPLDRMMINKDQIVFVEDLKDDSKVTDAIVRYKQEQTQGAGKEGEGVKAPQ